MSFEESRQAESPVSHHLTHFRNFSRKPMQRLRSRRAARLPIISPNCSGPIRAISASRSRRSMAMSMRSATPPCLSRSSRSPKPLRLRSRSNLSAPTRVAAAIGVEPSGDAFNSIRLRIDNRPFNPMVNSGAIACSGLIHEAQGENAAEYIRNALGRFAGRDLDVDESVFASERLSGDRNRAIAYLLRNYGIIKGDVASVLDVYFRQCSVLVTARDLALMAATLANGGVNPLNGERIVSPYAVSRTLSVMTSSGMYDFAGEWIYRVGIPAKSGVGGGIMAALPAQFGLGSFSPLLDEHGN